jgi:K+-transporting ATPase ATPase A chain
MVGRTPEYLGKKIEAYEMKMASLAILIPNLFTLFFTAIAVATESGRAGILNPGAHGFSEVLYAFSSMANNNGSAFGGLTATNWLYTLLGGIAMWASRFWLIIPTLAVAGSLGRKKLVPASVGTLPTHTLLFVVLLVGTVLLVGALTHLPGLALGPIVEHLQLFAR